MKKLKEYIKESILGDWNDVNADEISEKQQRTEVEDFLKENYQGKFRISPKLNKQGLFEVSSYGDAILKKSIPNLTNDKFIFTHINGDFIIRLRDIVSLAGCPKYVVGCFNCEYCNMLTSLEGAPEKVGELFSCSFCENLTSLEGSPKEVGKGFYCYGCESLTTLEGAPEKVGGGFSCSNCSSLKSLEGAPEKVGGDFNCSYCPSLKSLKGAPKEVGGDFSCNNCKVNFTQDDIDAVSVVKS